jgi:hypothetical protein
VESIVGISKTSERGENSDSFPMGKARKDSSHMISSKDPTEKSKGY